MKSNNKVAVVAFIGGLILIGIAALFAGFVVYTSIAWVFFNVQTENMADKVIIAVFTTLANGIAGIGLTAAASDEL